MDFKKGDAIEWNGANRALQGVVVDIYRRKTSAVGDDGKRAVTGERLEYVVLMDTGKHMVVDGRKCRAVQAATKRKRYDGPRFGNGNRVVPNVKSEVQITDDMVINF